MSDIDIYGCEVCLIFLHSVCLFYYYYYFLPWYFIPRVLKLAKVWNGYDGDSKTVKELARHTALKR